jgi:hypothetical protein
MTPALPFDLQVEITGGDGSRMAALRTRKAAMNDERHALFGAAGRPTRRPGRAPPERPPGASKTGLSLAELEESGAFVWRVS